MSHEIDVLLVVLSGALLVLAILSRLVKRLFLSSALVSLLAGIAVGPRGAGLIPALPPEVLEQVARVALAIGVMAIGLHATRRDVRENAGRAVRLLSIGMLGMWVITGLGAWLLLDVPFWVGFLAGAVLTPTDPIVASSLVSGKLAEVNLPRWLRRSLQIEAGANDGLALPFVLLPVIVLTTAAGAAGGTWAVEALKSVGIGVVTGGLMGAAAAKVLTLAAREREVERTEILYVGIALALTTLGATHLIGGSGVLAVFIAALVFSALADEQVREEIEGMQEAVSELLIPPVFVLFGASLPWAGWSILGWSGVAFVGWVLLLRRVPAVALALVGSGTGRQGTVFLSWFGPLGVAAIYYASFVQRFSIPGAETVFAAATLGICGSVVVHGLTGTPAVRAYAGRSVLETLRHPFHPGVEARE